MKKIILILLAYNISLGTLLSEPTDGETRTATLTYTVDPNDVIDLKAKYTDVNIEAWDKSEVLIEAIIRFDGKVTDKMQRFLDSFEQEVASNIDEGAGELVIDTNLDEPNKVQIGGRAVGIVVGFSEDELKLTYNLKVPSSNALKIKNSYRDLNLKGSYDDITIDQYSGDLEIEDAKEAELVLKYGTAVFGTIGTAEMELYEQDLTVGSIDKLDIQTKYSELKIDKLGETEITSYESDFEIDNLELLEGNLKYGKLEVTELFAKGELVTYEFDIEAKNIGTLVLDESKYGKTEAESIDRLVLNEAYEDDFDIDVLGTLLVDESKYANYDIGMLKNKIEINYAYEGSLDVDALDKQVTAVEINGKYVETSIDTDGVSYKLLANTKYGDINLDRNSMNVRKYIKEGDLLEIEATSTTNESAPLVLITIKGYEMDLELD